MRKPLRLISEAPKASEHPQAPLPLHPSSNSNLNLAIQTHMAQKPMLQVKVTHKGHRQKKTVLLTGNACMCASNIFTTAVQDSRKNTTFKFYIISILSTRNCGSSGLQQGQLIPPLRPPACRFISLASSPSASLSLLRPDIDKSGIGITRGGRRTSLLFAESAEAAIPASTVGDTIPTVDEDAADDVTFRVVFELTGIPSCSSSILSAASRTRSAALRSPADGKSADTRVSTRTANVSAAMGTTLEDEDEPGVTDKSPGADSSTRLLASAATARGRAPSTSSSMAA
mmetsp:Transcript_50505/g.93951  ORF Transcript_50505/g.93951 Transcript_50505/m.93951 type:complete len:286 (-) Transcript_50505:472-1329(-)